MIQTRLQPGGECLTLVAVAAVLVAGIRLRFLDLVVDPRRSPGPVPVSSANGFRRGQEMGWFEHGSTIIVLGEKGLGLSEAIHPGATIRMGEALMRRSGEALEVADLHGPEALPPNQWS